MSRKVFVHLLPSLFEPPDLKSGSAVVIDVLRASTTIVHALAAGAEAIIPCEEVDEARAVAANLPAGQALLGGERGGVRIAGFDLDNSPLKYTEQTVRGKTVVFTTTNGTRALKRAALADRVVVGTFVNLNAVVRLLLDEKRPIHLICAGTEGRISAEDCLFAGAVATAIWKADGCPIWTDDQTRMAMDFFAARSGSRAGFLEAMQSSRGGRNLRQLGMEADVERSAAWDLFAIVPEYDPSTGRIQIAAEKSDDKTLWFEPPA